MSLRRLSAAMLAVFYVVSVHAGDSSVQRQSRDLVSYADVFQWLFGLIIVLAMFGLLVWLLRKTGNFSSQSKSQLAVLSGLSLGMREKLVLVKVGDKQLLLGVTPGRVDKLMELEGDARLFLERADNGDSEGFAKKLQQVLQGNADG